MKTMTTAKGAIVLSFVIIAAAVSGLGRLDSKKFFSLPEAQAQVTCPPPTEAESGDCVLNQDATLYRTLTLNSSTTLNCKGHQLTAQTPGSGSTVDTYQASVPELAILLKGTTDATVKNCRLEDFDFGVMIIQSKIPQALKDDPSSLVLRRNRILSNTITARAAGVEVFGADNNEISLNTIQYTSGGGKGIHLHRDSDSNLVTGNTVSGSERPYEFARFLPGSDFEGGISGSAVITSNPPGRHFVLYNLIIDNTLVAQFPNVIGSRNSDNVIEGNNISLPGPSAGKAHAGIKMAVGSDRTVVRGNTVTGGRVGISGLGYPDAYPGVSPTTCTLDPARFCATNDDCFIAGVDSESRGTCPGTRTVIMDGRLHNTLVEDNILNGPFNVAAIEMESQVDAIMQDNRIHGAGSEIGIQLSSEVSRGGIVRRNVISGAGIGLVLTGYQSHPYGAQISLNDIRGSSFRAIEVGNAALGSGWGAPGAVELSAGQCAQDSSISCSSNKQCVDRGGGPCVNMRGNYWGRTCADSEGFREFHETGADSPKRSIVDSHPYGVSVAEAGIDEESLPATCK